MRKKLLLLFILNLISTLFFAQKKGQARIDSLLSELPKAKEDTIKVKILNKLCVLYKDIDEYDNGYKYGNQGLELAQKINYTLGEATILNSIGNVYGRQGKYNKALESHFASLQISKDLGDKNRVAASYSNIGSVYLNKGDIDKALENDFASLKIRKEIGDKNGIAISYSNIGSIYFDKGNYEKALENYYASLKMGIKTGDKRAIASSYNNIGNTYEGKGNYEKALENHLMALKIFKELDYKRGFAASYLNIGGVYFIKHNYKKSLDYSLEALKISQEIGDKDAVARCYINIGNNYLMLNKIKEAEQVLLLALRIAKEIGSKDNARLSYENLSKCDSALGNWKGAYEYHKLFKESNDSIFNAASDNKISEMTAKYESDSKEAIAKVIQDKKDAIAIEELNYQKFQRNAFVGGFTLMLILVGVSYNNFIRKKKDNKIITTQKELVEQKQKEILDSIEYALRIQSAILPTQKIVKQYLKNSFILYQPKDIVAGDFYWMETVNDLVLFAACDCTGHGVPGAMVSVICHNALNRAVREFGLTQPAAILDKTTVIVIENFSKSEEDIKDGMDISLCAYNPKTNTIEWAGANNPLWLLQNGELIETKADKQPIGRDENSKPFTNHTFKLNNGDTIYLFTDGFADQFGGVKRQKKLTKKRFKELLLSIQSQTMEEQGIELDKFITEYRKEIEQIDDILVMGMKV